MRVNNGGQVELGCVNSWSFTGKMFEKVKKILQESKGILE